MTGSTASASNNGERDLVVSVNWIGDAIMAMPALQVYRRLHPDQHIAVLARGVIADLWSMHDVPDEVIRYDGRPGLLHPLYKKLRAARFDKAWVLPNSFRSALIPFRSGIPVRRGVSAGYRNVLLTDVIQVDVPSHHAHQAWESIHMLNPSASLAEIPHPELSISDAVVDRALEKISGADGPYIGMIPGAARGPSKRWPEDHFVALGKRLVRDGFTILLFGSPDDIELCERMSGAIGGAVNLAGRTTFGEWAGLMTQCALILANDSGGMHLAAALNIPVVAMYGMTDPALTGPIGRHCVVLQKSKQRSRDIPRHSAQAVKSLASIRPEEVYEASRPFIKERDDEGDA